METPLSRLEAVQTKYTELLGKMKRLDQENARNKKRGDLFQKEKETQRTELTKTVSMKEKLEKLCRELTRENKKVKVGTFYSYIYSYRDKRRSISLQSFTVAISVC